MYLNKKHASLGLGVGAVSGYILWAYTNLGILFFALLILVFLNVIAALFEQDLLSSLHRWVKVTASVVVASIVPVFSKSAQLAWSMQDTRYLIAVVFAALATATIPDLITFFKGLLKQFGVGKTTADMVIADLQAQVKHYEALAQAQAKQPPLPSPSDTKIL